jgi:DNA-binding MarR family transcriptional regulator
MILGPLELKVLSILPESPKAKPIPAISEESGIFKGKVERTITRLQTKGLVRKRELSTEERKVGRILTKSRLGYFRASSP